MKTSKVKRFVFGALAAQGIVAVYGNSSSPAASPSSNLSGLDVLFDNTLSSAANEETEKAVGELEKAIREFSIGCTNACVPGDEQGTIDESVK